MNQTLEELYFWSGIMRDHGEFLYSALSPKESNYIETSQYFHQSFSEVHQEANIIMKKGSDNQIDSLVNKSISLLKQFIDFKRLILTKQLTCEISILFTPSFINHMLNEANEFYRHLFATLPNKTTPDAGNAFVLHKIWLRDASGHAAAIACDLDPTESLLIKQGNEFKTKFDQLFIKAFELQQMYERTDIENGAKQYLNTQVKDTMVDFIIYLDKVKTLRVECKALGAINPLIPDHMIREEKYYLTKLTEARNLL